MLNKEISKLVYYALNKGLIKETDRIWATNCLLDVLRLDEFEEVDVAYDEIELENVLNALSQYAISENIIEDTTTCKDLFTTKVMGVFTPKPSEMIEVFGELYEEDPVKATDYFYAVSIDSDYIRKYRVIKDLKWSYNSAYGDLDITVNLSKPEKDPKDIAAERLAKQSGYPKCMLCKENEGYAGRLNHPARQNLRAMPVTINNEQWYFQYSPYTYYNEHSIIFKGEHEPMVVDKSSFRKLLDFVKQFPHYFVGSNADLPIVGGSILSHDHFQGGSYTFAMEKAEKELDIEFKGFEDVSAQIVKWPMSVIRIKSKNDNRLVELADHILEKWRAYSDKDSFIFAYTEDTPHNTITPISRKKGEFYEFDLVLRNNICTDEHPLGVYHPHKELHNIKKENIGLIEVMGLAVLPARLKKEMSQIADIIVNKQEIPESLCVHRNWVEGILAKHENITAENVDTILENEVGLAFEKVLEDAGVFKCTEEGRAAFLRFIEYVNI